MRCNHKKITKQKLKNCLSIGGKTKEKSSSERLQEIITKKRSDRKKETNFCVTEHAVKILSEGGVREVEQLNGAEKEKVIARANKVD